MAFWLVIFLRQFADAALLDCGLNHSLREVVGAVAPRVVIPGKAKGTAAIGGITAGLIERLQAIERVVRFCQWIVNGFGLYVHMYVHMY